MTLSLNQRLDAFATALAQSQEHAASGTPLDLKGLDDLAAELCAAALAAPADERQGVADRLTAIVRSLDALAATLGGDVPQTDEGHGSRRARADRAYRAGEPRPGERY